MSCIIYEGGLPKNDCELIINYSLNDKRFTEGIAGDIVDKQNRKSDVIFLNDKESLFENEIFELVNGFIKRDNRCLLYTSQSPRDRG